MTYKKPEPEKTKVKSNPDDWWYSLKMKSKIKAKKFWSDYNESAKKQIPTKENLKKGVIYKAIKEKVEKKKSIKAKRILNSNASN
jgi:hypothetical protein